MSGAPVLLIADDDPSDVFFFRKALAEVCPHVLVHAVGDGGRALAWLEGQGPFADRAAYPLPSYLVLDVKMPSLSGLEVLRWIRSNADPERAPSVAILSGSALDADREQATRLDAHYYVKPVSFHELCALVRDLAHRFALTSAR